MEISKIYHTKRKNTPYKKPHLFQGGLKVFFGQVFCHIVYATRSYILVYSTHLHYFPSYKCIYFFVYELTFGFTCDSWGTLRHEHRTCDRVSSHSHCGVSHRLWALATWPLIISTAATSAIHWCIIVIVRGRRRPIVPAGHRHLSILGPPRRRRKRVRRRPFTVLKTIYNQHVNYIYESYYLIFSHLFIVFEFLRSTCT